MKHFVFLPILYVSFSAFAQATYKDSMTAFLKNYVGTHEVVKGEDRKDLQFYPVSKDFRTNAQFQKSGSSQWITFPTSGKITKVFRLYGTLSFQLAGKPLRLNVYQSQDLLPNEQYKNYLFLPFTDATTGTETYEGGRYIDLSTTDIQNGTVVLDFNKAYNPYCAYVSGKYNCPIPPRENRLAVPIRAGEKAYNKRH